MATIAPYRPRFWIVGGPNGSGKSTLYGRNDVAGFDGSVWIVNPDLLTVRLMEAEKLSLDAANLAAVRRIAAWLHSSMEVHQTIGVETVLSTPKYREVVRKAREKGFEFSLLYIYVASAEQQLERIKARVAKGGHDVPEDRVRGRRERSFNELPWFFWASDFASIFDNSSGEPQLVASKIGPRVTFDDNLLGELRERLLDPARPT